MKIVLAIAFIVLFSVAAMATTSMGSYSRNGSDQQDACRWATAAAEQDRVNWLSRGWIFAGTSGCTCSGSGTSWTCSVNATYFRR
jgi:glutamate/tyrosine decarboxylase-like PLP-dependent enzyme